MELFSTPRDPDELDNIHIFTVADAVLLSPYYS